MILIKIHISLVERNSAKGTNFHFVERVQAVSVESCQDVIIHTRQSTEEKSFTVPKKTSSSSSTFNNWPRYRKAYEEHALTQCVRRLFRNSIGKVSSDERKFHYKSDACVCIRREKRDRFLFRRKKLFNPSERLHISLSLCSEWQQSGTSAMTRVAFKV